MVKDRQVNESQSNKVISIIGNEQTKNCPNSTPNTVFLTYWCEEINLHNKYSSAKKSPLGGSIKFADTDVHAHLRLSNIAHDYLK